MVLLLNILVPLVVIALLYLAWRIKNWHPALIALVFVVAYGALQPSYMPKGTVKPLPNPEFHVNDSPMVDRLMKPKSPEQYDLERKQALDAIDKSLKEQIESNKQRLTELEKLKSE